MFVEPEFRGRGIARDLLKLSDAALAERNIQYAVLHATSEMAKVIKSAETWPRMQ